MTPDIAFPTERNTKNDVGVLDRLMKSLKQEVDGARGGLSTKEMAARIKELEPMQLEAAAL